MPSVKLNARVRSATALPHATGHASNALRRAVFFHCEGDPRDRTFENQGFGASGLSLITAAIVHWKTVNLHRAVQPVRARLPVRSIKRSSDGATSYRIARQLR